jgi:lipopolysaccharide export system permease protein
MRAPLPARVVALPPRPRPATATTRPVRLSATLSRYLGRQVLFGIGLMLFGLAAVALVIDTVELLRRTYGRPGLHFGTVMLMAGLHLPFLVQKLLPFGVLFGTMLTFQRLTRSHELVVARAAGVSVWQFLLPALTVALVLGGFAVVAFNPLASALVARYEALDRSLLAQPASLIAVAPGGLWLRQTAADGSEVLFHARQMNPDTAVAEQVVVFSFDSAGTFASRIDALQARLGDGSWELINPLISQVDGSSRVEPALSLPTDLTPYRIQESFAAPETLSFWDLPTFVEELEAVGFSAREHRLYWHGLLALPLLLAAMLLIGTTSSLRLVRRGGTGLLITAGLATGFLFYVLSDVVFAVGLSGRLPAFLAAWIPAGVAVLLGCTTLLHLEDG